MRERSDEGGAPGSGKWPDLADGQISYIVNRGSVCRFSVAEKYSTMRRMHGSYQTTVQEGVDEERRESAFQSPGNNRGLTL